MDKLKRVMTLCLFCTGRTIILFLFIASHGKNGWQLKIKSKKTSIWFLFLFFPVQFSPVYTVLKIDVPNSINALKTSCVVIPCSFKPVEENFESSSLKGIWYRERKNEEKELVYDEDETRAAENFRGRTQLLGHLGQSNCTLEMLKIADHDEGSYCFTMESQEPQSNCIKLSIRCTSRLPASVISDTVPLLKYNIGPLSPCHLIHRSGWKTFDEHFHRGRGRSALHRHLLSHPHLSIQRASAHLEQRAGWGDAQTMRAGLLWDRVHPDHHSQGGRRPQWGCLHSQIQWWNDIFGVPQALCEAWDWSTFVGATSLVSTSLKHTFCPSL